MSIKQIVLSDDGRRMVMLPEDEYDALVEAIEDARDALASRAADGRIAAGAEEFIPEAIAERIFDGDNLVRVWREYRGLSLTDLASEAKMLDEELAEIETDQQSPTVEQLKLLARALKVTMDDLVRG